MEKINKNCGVYQIRNIITNVCYDGQSINLKGRPGQHWNNLKYNRHKNSHLQNSYNKYGRDSFVFEILIYCAPKDLTYYEQLFCDIDKSHRLSYNIRDCVDSNKGLKPTEETKAKRLKNMPDQSGKNNPFYGKKHTEETKKLMCKNQMDQSGENNPNITKKEIVLNIFQMLKNGTNVGIIAKKLKIDRHIVSRVKNGFYNKIYNLPDTEWNIIPKSTIEKKVILKVINMLENGFIQKDISKKLGICTRTIYMVKKGFYNDIYNLPEKKWDTNPHIIEKDIILQIIDMLDKNIQQKDIAFEMDVCLKTVRRAKQGFYNDTYNL